MYRKCKTFAHFFAKNKYHLVTGCFYIKQEIIKNNFSSLKDLNRLNDIAHYGAQN